MTKTRILWAVTLGAALAFTGCGDDPQNPDQALGTGGTGGMTGTGGVTGMGGTGGSGGGAGSNGTASSSCEAICGTTCFFGGITPGDDFGLCVSTCETQAPELNDNCGPQMESYLSCIVGDDCNIASLNCLAQASAWTTCQGG